MGTATRNPIPDTSPQVVAGDETPLELSIVMPCLDEAATLEICIRKAFQAMRKAGIRGEVVIADNGSNDGSQEIARRLGARVVQAEARGYGNALRAGIEAACGKYIIMGDADDSYDFGQVPDFAAKLRAGYELVVGNRFRGGIESGAMRPLHRYLGVPVLSSVARFLFKSPLGDNHCGLRGFSKAAFREMRLCGTGWEFGSELNLKASLMGMRVTEIPTKLAPDGRSRPPHLRTWQAGWRHLRLMLLYSPRWLFLYPGLVLLAGGFATMLWLLPGPRILGHITLNVHTLLYAATAVLMGMQSITFALFTQIYANREGLLPHAAWSDWALRTLKLESLLLTAIALIAAGLGLGVYAVSTWQALNFGDLDATRALRLVIPSALCLSLGGHLALSGFFLSVLQMRQKNGAGPPVGNRLIS